MIITVLKNKMINAFLLLAMMGISTLGCISHQDNLYFEADTIAPIMYLVPADLSIVEELVKPEELLANQKELSIGVTSDWTHIYQLISNGTTQAIIIHHAASNLINLEELQQLFEQKHLVVVGIGIPGDKLAQMIGKPNYYNEKMGRYEPPAYFFAYSSHPEQGWARADNDLLTIDDGIGRMLQTIENHFLDSVK